MSVEYNEDVLVMLGAYLRKKLNVMVPVGRTVTYCWF